MQLPTKQDTVANMSSLELVEIINSLRKSGEPAIRHDNLMRRIENHPGIDSPRWRGEYKDSTGRSLKCYHLPKRECELLVMAESLEVQTKVYDRMVELQQEVQRLHTPAEPPPLNLDRREVALSLSHKQVRDLDTVLRYAKMEFEPHDDCVDREFVNGKFKILHALVQSAMPARLPAVEPAPLPTLAAPKPDDTPDLPMHAGGYYAIIRDVPCLRLGDEVFLPLSPTCRAIGTAPACYHQSAAAREGSFLTSLPYRGQTRKLLMVPISYWEEKLGRARLRQSARGQLGGLLQEVRSGLFATVH